MCGSSRQGCGGVPATVMETGIGGVVELVCVVARL
jgi:hypothetical protein